MGILMLIVLLVVECLFLIWSMSTKETHAREKGLVNLALLFLLIVLLGTGALQGIARYGALLFVLAIFSISGIRTLVKKTEPSHSTRSCVMRRVGAGACLVSALLPALVFPQQTALVPTGGYEVETSLYTWEDTNRQETFSQNGAPRKLTVAFWYPKAAEKSAPLILFSHGAFGYSGSNRSTFEELASNGYVVASIGHSYHAMYVRHSDGSVTVADMDFVRQAAALNATHDISRQDQTFATTRKWLALRTWDEAFVLDTIVDDRIHSFNLADVLYFEAVDERVFACTSRRTQELKIRLYELEKAYRDEHFIRCSKSFLVNLMKLESISPALNGRFAAHMKNGETVIISRQYVPALKRAILGG